MADQGTLPLEEKDIDVEKLMQELEKIVSLLEGGKLSLEEQLKLFERGVHLSRLCMKELQKVEKKIEVLSQESDKIILSPLKTAEE